MVRAGGVGSGGPALTACCPPWLPPGGAPISSAGEAVGGWLPTRRKLRGSGDRRGCVLGACCLSPHGGAATLVAGTWAVVCGRLLDEALIFVVRGKDKVDRHRAHTETRRTQVFPFDLLLLV
jgi:hypothetical protein